MMNEFLYYLATHNCFNCECYSDCNHYGCCDGLAIERGVQLFVFGTDCWKGKENND